MKIADIPVPERMQRLKRADINARLLLRASRYQHFNG